MPFRPMSVAVVCAVMVLGAACSSAPDTATVETNTSAAPATDTSVPSPTLGPSVATPVLGRVLAAPIPVPSTDGKVHLAYELVLTNMLAQEVTITSVDVRSGDRFLLSLPGDRLADWTRLAGHHTPTTTLGPAQTAFVWLDVAVPADSAVPAQLTHAVGVSVPDPMPPLIPATLTENVAPVTVQTTRKPITIAPPLKGANWLDANGCCEMTSHRLALNPINGEVWAAERFAIDYVQLDHNGRLFTGEQDELTSYPYYGDDVLAVGNGPVVATVDGLPEQVPGTAPTGLPLEQYGGNHVVQYLGNDNYAFYAHLKTGSVKVRPGDQLTEGQTLGALGNSGNTDAPHLHFHIMDTPDPLRSNGLAFVLSSFRLDSRFAGDIEDLLDDGPAQFQPDFTPRNEKSAGPLVYDVMTYVEH